MSRKTAVIAFGGNVLIGPEDHGTMSEQLENADHAAKMLLEVLRRDFQMVLVHGNGPQVGNNLIRVEESSTKIPPSTLDVCVADTEGSMGYLMEVALRNRLRRAGMDKEMVTLVTEVEVDANDSAFQNPTKPIGPFYTKFRAQMMREEHGWQLVEDSGRGYRRVVPSPKPVRILQADVARRLLDQGFVVTVAGGGGIPVSFDEAGMMRGEEAVIDKDYSASLMASSLQADLFVILTGVSRVCIDFGLPTQRALDVITIERAQQLLDEGQFPPGSMGPKIRASIDFLNAGGKEVIITSPDVFVPALDGRSGTRIRKNR
jgi:carbamate kinase